MNSSRLIDWRLIVPCLVIMALSLSILFSISPNLAWTQLSFILLGTGLFVIFSRFNYQHHLPLAKIYTFASLLLLILPIIFGVVTRGSVRWIQFGPLTLQPSEIIKPFLIIIFSSLLSKKLNLLAYFIALLIPSFLIFKQPDLGSTLVVLAIWFGIWFVSKLPLIALFISSLSITFLSPIVYKILKPYQQQRVLSFLNPYADPKGSGYQVIQSTIAVGSGKLFGQGLGQGTQSQLNFLPERQTDFIFATLAEELGFIGTLVLLVAIYFLLTHLLNIAKKAPDKFGQMIVIGVFSMIFFQVFVNIGMNLGLLPITGITLPLVSAGGSSMLATMIALGIVHNISLKTANNQSLEIK
jgi:rod shape determining protein RodA